MPAIEPASSWVHHVRGSLGNRDRFPAMTTPLMPEIATAGARVRLNPHPAGGRLVAGGWWPRSRDAAVELRALVAALTPLLGTIVRLGVDGFAEIPHRIVVDGQVVRIGWFSGLRQQVIIRRRHHDHLLLLVIPHDTGEPAALDALGRAAADQQDGDAAGILARSGIAVPPAIRPPVVTYPTAGP
jgi:hypothetical protein